MTQVVNILYVDDEPINLILFNAVFKSTFIVHTASSGEAGIQILQEHNNIKAVVSDMKMPGMDGLEFVQKASDQFPLIKYFILTGYDVTPEIQSFLDSGLVCKCFQKPLNVKDIASSISEV